MNTKEIALNNGWTVEANGGGWQCLAKPIGRLVGEITDEESPGYPERLDEPCHLTIRDGLSGQSFVSIECADLQTAMALWVAAKITDMLSI